MMAERGIHVDHSTIHRWVVHFSPLLLERLTAARRTERQSLPATARAGCRIDPADR
jgi:transposase-like protein